MLESAVKKSLRAYLKAIGAYQYWPVKLAYGAKTVDCLVCYRGKFYAIETKKPGKKATKFQETTMYDVESAGGQAWTEDDPELCITRSIIKP
jgi:hypothetical protein